MSDLFESSVRSLLFDLARSSARESAPSNMERLPGSTPISRNCNTISCPCQLNEGKWGKKGKKRRKVKENEEKSGEKRGKKMENMAKSDQKQSKK